MGSRAYGIEDSDYDYILIGNLPVPSFSQQCVCLSKISPNFKYVKFIDGRIPTLNLITQDGDEINLIYQKKDDISIGVQNSIDSVKIIKNMISDHYQLFVECYHLVRVWAKRRHIYGSKYGYFIFENKKIVSPLVKITIEEPDKFNAYEKQYQMMSEIWRIPLSTPGVIPGVNWKETDSQLSYKFKVSPDSDSQIIYSYFRKFQCLVEFL